MIARLILIAGKCGQIVHALLPIIIVTVTFLTVGATLYYSQGADAPHERLDSIGGLVGGFLRHVFVVWLQVGHQNPTLAVLQGVNLATALYAIVYYMLLEELHGWSKLSILLLLIIINYLGYAVAVGGAESRVATINNSQESFSFISAYLVSELYLLLFAIIDAMLHFNSRVTARRWYYGFSSFYVQIPALISLTLAGILQNLMSSYQVSEPESISFLAGVSAATMFISNLVLALMDSRWYCKRRIAVVLWRSFSEPL